MSESLRIFIPAAAPVDNFAALYNNTPKLLCPVAWADNMPLVRHVLSSRAYTGDEVDICFGLRIEQWSRDLALSLHTETNAWARAAGFSRVSIRIVPITRDTRGAADTVLFMASELAPRRGIWQSDTDDTPVTVDLCDITFEQHSEAFAAGTVPAPALSSLAVFHTKTDVDPVRVAKYSYAVPLDESLASPGMAQFYVKSLYEKWAVSYWASAGVYTFSNTRTMANACAVSLSQEKDAVNKAWFVCPALNYALPCIANVVKPKMYLGSPESLKKMTLAISVDDPQHPLV